MAKSKLDPLGEGSKKAKEFQEIMSGATVTLEEFIAANTKMSQELQNITQQSSAFFQLAAEGASKAASEMKNVSDSSATTSQNISSLTGAIAKQGKAFEKANKEAGFKKGGDGKNNVFEQLGKSSKVAKAGVIALGGAFNLLGKAIKGVGSIIGGIFDVLSTAVGAIKSIIGGVIDLASNAFETMVSMSDQVKDRMFEAAQAIEKVKETFGNLEKGSGKQISGFVKKVMGMYNPGAVRQIFGSITEAADYALGLASSSAEMASLLSDQLDNNATKIAMFAKGLGQTTEDFKAVMDMAYTTGESIDNIQESMLKFSQGIGNRLNLNVKVLSKNLLLAAKDVKHFGKATVQSMAESAAYATRMGVSLDKIVGVLDKFDTFEDAANNVSKLSQAFGVNLDTMKLVEADTTEERIEMLKDSFNAAGKSLDSLSRRELSYAASLIGTDEATLKNVLSNKNQANSLDDIKNASAATAKQTRSTTDIMNEAMAGVAMTLKKIERQSTGFFDVFLDGIAEGIFLSGPFQKVLANLAMALEAVFLAGKQLGMIIVKTFPGLEKMLNSLAKFFDPTKIGDLFGGFTTSFEKFFKNLRNGTGDVKDLFKDLFNNIKSYFMKQGSAGQEFLSGVSEFWGAVKQIIATAMLAVGDLIADGLNYIADLLSGERKISGLGSLSKAAGKGVGAIKKEFSPISSSFEKALEKIGPAWDKVFNQISQRLDAWWTKTRKRIEEWWSKFDLLEAIQKNPGTAKFLAILGIGKVLSMASTVVSAGQLLGKLFGKKFSETSSEIITKTVFGKDFSETSTMTPGGMGGRGGIGRFLKKMPKGAKMGGAAALGGVALGFAADYAKEKGQQGLGGGMQMGSRALEFGGTGAMIGSIIPGVGTAIGAAVGATLGVAYSIAFDNALDDMLVTKLPSAEEIEKRTANILEMKKGFKEASASGDKSKADAVFGDLYARIDQQLARQNREVTSIWNTDPDVIEQQNAAIEEYFDTMLPTLDSDRVKELLRQHEASMHDAQGGSGTFEGLTSAAKLQVEELEKQTIGVYLAPSQLEEKGLNDVQKAYYKTLRRTRRIKDRLDEAQKDELPSNKAAREAAMLAKKNELEGKRLQQETLDSLGITTVDNVEERIKKIIEIGDKLTAGRGDFIKSMEKIKGELKYYAENFVLFDAQSGSEQKFRQMVGQVAFVQTFFTAINKMVAEMDQMGKIAAGLGSSVDVDSISSRVVNGLISVRDSLTDIVAQIIGGTNTAGDTIAEKDTFVYLFEHGVKSAAGEQGGFALAFSKAKNLLDQVATNVKALNSSDLATAMGAATSPGGVLSTDFATGLKTIGTFMGPNGVLSYLGQTADLHPTFSLVKSWTTFAKMMFRDIGQALQEMDNSLSPIDSLSKRVESLSELKGQLDSMMQNQYFGQNVKVEAGAPRSDGGAVPAKASPSKIQTPTGLNVTLNFEITMDAKSLDSAINTRQGSIVVEALNTLAFDSGKHAYPLQGQKIMLEKI